MKGDHAQAANAVSFEEMIVGSFMFVLEITLAIQVHKVSPFGYERVLVLFRAEGFSQMTAAHCAWLIAEAEAAGQLEQMHEEHPHAAGRSYYIKGIITAEFPEEMRSLWDRIRAPVYSVQTVRAYQREKGGSLWIWRAENRYEPL